MEAIKREAGEVSSSAVVDRDPSLAYELRAWPYLLTLPIIYVMAAWAMLKTFSVRILLQRRSLSTANVFFDGMCKPLRIVRHGAASWVALDTIYNYRKGQYGSPVELIDFWMRTMNAQAVRNRLRLVKRELKELLIDLTSYKSTVRIMSIASGGAQSVISVMQELNGRGIRIEALFLDRDPSAIEYSKRLAREAGVFNQVTFVTKSTHHLDDILPQFRPDVVEMVGLLDYLPEERAVRLISKIHDALPQGGYFLTANISNNVERFFLRWVIGWWMIYRSASVLRDIITKSGFTSERVTLMYEPFRIHCLAIAKKR